MMKPIGGYFGLELPKVESKMLHFGYHCLNSSRNALEYILLQLQQVPGKIYLPYYTCEVVLEPLQRLGINYEFYHINYRLELDSLPRLEESEYVIVNNYFGIKDKYIDTLYDVYGDRLIVDNAQAYYYIPKAQAIYSPRKFFGVPDGGLAKTTDYKKIELNRDYSTQRSIHLLRRIDAGAEAGFKEYQEDDRSLRGGELKWMSQLTMKILEGIDYERVATIRRNNFALLHSKLAEINRLAIGKIDELEIACPMVYPFYTDDFSLRKRLIDEKIFVATYWPNVFEWCEENTVEYQLAKNIIPLPIDQRYDRKDMQRIINVLRV